MQLMNSKNLEDKAKKLEDAIKALEDLRVRDAEDYNLVKIKLETDIQVLEQQLQQVSIILAILTILSKTTFR